MGSDSIDPIDFMLKTFGPKVSWRLQVAARTHEPLFPVALNSANALDLQN